MGRRFNTVKRRPRESVARTGLSGDSATLEDLVHASMRLIDGLKFRNATMRQMLLNVTFVCLAATCLTNSAKAQYVDADDTTSVIIPVMLDELPFLLGESAYWARTAAAAETYAARSYPAYQQQCLAAASFYHAADELALYAIAAYVSADPAKSDYVDRLKDCEAYARLSRQYANLGYQYGRFSRNYGHLSIVRSDECIELLVRVWPML